MSTSHEMRKNKAKNKTGCPIKSLVKYVQLCYIMLSGREMPGLKKELIFSGERVSESFKKRRRIPL